MASVEIRPPRHIDTIVFVHGIVGHYVNTWGEFPKLLHEDPDLPEVDILLWSYRTGIFAKHHDKPDLAWRQVGAGLALSGSVDAGDAEKITTAAYVPTHDSADALSAAARRLHSIDAEMDRADQEEKDPTVYLERAEVQAKLGLNREALKSP